MREIKFRVWNVANNEMSESFTLKEFAFDQDGEQGSGYFSLDSYGIKGEDVPNHLMQFTGLYDKNKKEIYEGDIITHPFLGRKEVKWLERTAQFNVNEADKSEVLGNIYENPELLVKP